MHITMKNFILDKSGIISIIAFLAIFIYSCKPDRVNPWDEKMVLNPDEWMPNNFAIENMSITSNKLTWVYTGNENIEGFEVERKYGSSDVVIEIIKVNKDVRQWIDDTITPDTTLAYTYSLFTIAGENKSSFVTATSPVNFPPPTNLQVASATPTSVALSWNYAATGHQGFRIDRKAGEGNWQEAYASASSSQTSYNDYTVSYATTTSYSYRVYAYYNQYNSAKEEISVSKPKVITANVMDITGVTAVSGGTVTNDGGLAVTARGVVWSNNQNPTITSNQGITIDGTGTGNYTSNITGLNPSTNYYLRAYATNSIGTQYGNEQMFTTHTISWFQKSDFAGIVRSSAVGFSIGGKGYVGTGYNNSYSIYTHCTRDFWEYDPITNTWSQKADYAGGDLTNAVGFSIGNRGYVGTGAYRGPNGVFNIKNIFYEYNPDSNTWTRKTDVPGAYPNGRTYAIGFSIGEKGYIGIGWDTYNGYYKNFYEYDPSTDTWTKKLDFSGSERIKSVGFSIGTKGYIGLGGKGSIIYSDFWEYDPYSNTWSQKADFEGDARYSAVGFSIGVKGYVGLGTNGNSNKNDLWEFNQSTNTWRQLNVFEGSPRHSSVGFSIGAKGYIGLGDDGPSYSNSFKKDFWEFY